MSSDLRCSMRIALICPFSVGPARGNITTARRIALYLAESGCLVTQIPLDTLAPEGQQALLEQSRPELLHAFHAYHAGPTAREAARVLGIPYLITFTGSDLFDPGLRNDPATRLAIADAACVTCFDPLVADHLIAAFPAAAVKLSVIPQGVTPLPITEPFPRSADEFVILLPAAMRPVKGIVHALEALTPLAMEFPVLRLLLAGGELDPAYSAIIRERAENLPWVRLLGNVPHERMGALYAAADLVLNCSLFEGGMANTMLEAMIMARPVLARDVTGNRSLIRHAETGWLYKNGQELTKLVRLLLRNRGRGVETGEAGRRFVRERFSPRTEAKSYAALYGQMTRPPISRII